MWKEDRLLEIDRGTAAALEALAKAWNMSRKEAIRKVVAEAKASAANAEAGRGLNAFRELQRRLHLTPEDAASWQAILREGRR